MGLQEDNERLRQLAQAVMRRECTHDDYRAQRRTMVDGWAGEAPADPPPAIEQTAPNLPVVEPPGPPPAVMHFEDPPQDVVAPQRGDLWIGLAVVVVVVLVVAGALAWFW